ncbi:sulfite exporter TauE/SafE family protein [Accumulibacter sp.]|uniref:sulfite exporter TauE/SafE family protein n=1 Tax=Accumulibacter sp. TaxID=2053492 RepID=UPI0025FF0658|nr:sulfite exporter TauE/SafE family protein [Accumulibacter sp.]MCM8595061.1 sulfite exporter TauE/SafE family protein [Accumulibacter sp.]MDS4049207.1 sulfite exporter TauE/SafE family protein [Accumulibacter sp.]
MPLPAYPALLLVGFLGGVHCIGMCGGIVGALSMGAPASIAIHLAYSAGRLLSYACAGALAGGLGEASMAMAGQWPVRTLLYLAANLMLIALGLHLMGRSQAIVLIERAGARLWHHLQPLTRRYLPARSLSQAFRLGVLWGWLPCGLVYSALATALTSGSAWHGAGLMLAFGVGTLPNLLLAGLLATRLQARLSDPVVRLGCGLVILGFGVWGLIGVVGLSPLPA